MSSRFFIPLANLVAGLVICAAVAWAAPWATFLADDSHIVQVARLHDFWSPYLNPAAYQQLSAAHFTPTVISLYQWILGTSGLNPLAFLLVQAVLFGLLVLVLNIWLCNQTGSPVANWVFGVVGLLSLSTWGPMLTRFYTMHYLLGGLCAALAAWLIIDRRLRGHALLLPLGLLALALASKEVYLMVLPLLFGWALLQRRWWLMSCLMLVVLAYLGWRSAMIGISLEGRNNVSFLRDLQGVTLEQWRGFVQWFVLQRLGLLSLTLLALWSRPREMLMHLLWVVPFALPTLAAPHGFREPWLHADRLFFAFDLAWIAAVTLVVSSVWRDEKSQRPALVCVLLVVGLGGAAWQTQQYARFAVDVQSTEEHRLVTGLMARVAAPGQLGNATYLILIPEGYLMGSLWSHQGNVRVTALCDEALSLTRDQAFELLAPDSTGRVWLTRDQVALRCQAFAASPVIQVTHPPTYRGGVLSWQISSPDPELRLGVAFPERPLVLWMPVFEHRVVAPLDNEQFVIVARKNNQWWRGPSSKLLQPR